MQESFLGPAESRAADDLEAPPEGADEEARNEWAELGMMQLGDEPGTHVPAEQLTPVKMWRVVKLVVYLFCALSALDACGNVATVISFAYHGDWAAFVVAICFMSAVSCLISVAAVVGDHGAQGAADRGSERGILDSDGGQRGAAMAFFKFGGFRIAYRTLWFLERAEIMAAAQTWQDEDLCEHLLPLFMFVSSQAMLESWPILLLKCFVLGRNHGITGGEGNNGTVLILSICTTVALLAAIPMFVDKISCDFRQVYVRGNSSTDLGRRFLGCFRLTTLFTFRYAEALSWYLGLVMFARVFKGWFWM
jgi:hypothetical protein